jgi:hypothetical protein
LEGGVNFQEMLASIGSCADLKSAKLNYDFLLTAKASSIFAQEHKPTMAHMIQQMVENGFLVAAGVLGYFRPLDDKNKF